MRRQREEVHAAFIARVLVRVARGVTGRVADIDGLHHAVVVGAHRLAVVERGAGGVRREVRVQIRDALRNMGLIIDFVNSVDEASEFCREGLPHAIVIESIQRGEKFAHLREEISAEVPDFVFIEIIEEGNTFEMSGFSGSNVARVGRDVIDSSLPSALMFELSKGL